MQVTGTPALQRTAPQGLRAALRPGNANCHPAVNVSAPADSSDRSNVTSPLCSPANSRAEIWNRPSMVPKSGTITWALFVAPSKNACRTSASELASLNSPRPEIEARLTPAPASNSRQRSTDSACVISTSSALNAILRLRSPATVTKPAPPSILSRRSLPFCAPMGCSLSCRFGDGAKPHQRVIGAPVGFAPDVGDGEAEIHQPVPGRRERRVVERLQQRADDDMGLLMAALPRPRMQRQLMFLGRTVVGGRIDDARLAERDIGKRRIARRLVIDMGAAKRGGQRGIGDQRVVDGGAEGDMGGWHGRFLYFRAPDAAQRVALAKRCAAEPGP